jgi:crotonobetainyl-CoA:carnitine CoA-transferase CaiB-like acyl-CoA transferase
VIGAPELLTDPRFENNAAMQANGEAMIEEIERRMAHKNADEWATELGRRGVPASPVRTLAEAASGTHARARGLVESTSFQQGGNAVDIVGAGVRFEHDSPRLHGAVPALGEYTEQMLLDLGYTADRIEALRKDGVI